MLRRTSLHGGRATFVMLVASTCITVTIITEAWMAHFPDDPTAPRSRRASGRVATLCPHMCTETGGDVKTRAGGTNTRATPGKGPPRRMGEMWVSGTCGRPTPSLSIVRIELAVTEIFRLGKARRHSASMSPSCRRWSRASCPCASGFLDLAHLIDVRRRRAGGAHARRWGSSRPTRGDPSLSPVRAGRFAGIWRMPGCAAPGMRPRSARSSPRGDPLQAGRRHRARARAARRLNESGAARARTARMRRSFLVSVHRGLLRRGEVMLAAPRLVATLWPSQIRRESRRRARRRAAHGPSWSRAERIAQSPGVLVSSRRQPITGRSGAG